MPQIYNIDATQGSTLLLNLNVNDSLGNPINLTNYVVKGYVKYNYSSTGILLNLNPFINPATASSGVIQISGKAEDLANVPVGKFPYDIEVSGINDFVFKPIKGTININPEVTY